MEESNEFKYEIKKIKKYYEAERKEYDRVTEKELDTYFNNFTDGKIKNLLDMREFSKLKERKRVIDGNIVVGDNILLSSIISGKIAIDIIKDVEDKIDSMLFAGKIDEEDLNVLKLYNRRYKYHYLTSNNFVEGVALEQNFDLDKIQKIDFQEIEEAFNIRITDKSQGIFFEYIKDSLDDLVNINTNDKYETNYLSMLYVAKIKSILPYLNKEYLIKASYLFDDNSYKFEKNSAIVKVKKMVNRRKDELNN